MLGPARALQLTPQKVISMRIAANLLIASSLVAFGLAGCDSGESKDKPATSDPKPAKTDPTKQGENKVATQDGGGKKTGPKAADPTANADQSANDCCKFCLGTVDCGDECIDEGKTCEQDAGCACSADKRPAPTFKKGDRALQGLIAADVAAYNKAQGDPVDGLFTLEQAFEGDEKLADTEGGTLYATFKTSMGEFECKLFEEQAPYTVANFVGLVRGVRPHLDPETKEWTKSRFYDGILFHRVIEGFMLQTGDPTGTGTGSPGYFVPDEFDKTLEHNSAGILSMANRNRVDPRSQKLNVDEKTGQTLGNTGSSQFFVTVAATPHLDGRHTVFGKCADASVPKEISKVKVRTNRAQRVDHKPVEDVTLEQVTITRR